MLGLLPAVSASAKLDEEKENKTNLIAEADVLYNEHSYTKLRNLLLQFKVMLHKIYFLSISVIEQIFKKLGRR